MFGYLREYLEEITYEYRERIALWVFPELRTWIRDAERNAYNRGYRDHETIRQIEAALVAYKKNQPKTKKTKTNK